MTLGSSSTSNVAPGKAKVEGFKRLRRTSEYSFRSRHLKALRCEPEQGFENLRPPCGIRMHQNYEILRGSHLNTKKLTKLSKFKTFWPLFCLILVLLCSVKPHNPIRQLCLKHSWLITTHPYSLRLRGQLTSWLFVWCALSNPTAALSPRAHFSSRMSSVKRGEPSENLSWLELILTLTRRPEFGYTKGSCERVWVNLKLKWIFGRSSAASVPFSKGRRCQCSSTNRWTSPESGKRIPNGRWLWPIIEVTASERGRLTLENKFKVVPSLQTQNQVTRKLPSQRGI